MLNSLGSFLTLKDMSSEPEVFIVEKEESKDAEVDNFEKFPTTFDVNLRSKSTNEYLIACDGKSGKL